MRLTHVASIHRRRFLGRMCRGAGNAVPAEQWISGPWNGARLREVSIGCLTDTISALLLRQKTSTARKSEPKTLNLERAISMAKSSTSMEKLKGFLSSQISDEEKWALNSVNLPLLCFF
ncbi:unnamed protein product [Musa acuminata subsp. burmannicoides]